MRIEVKASLILVALVTVLSIVLEVSGLNKDFLVGQMVFLIGAIVLNVGIVYWALQTTAGESTYGRQLLRSAAIGVLGGALIVVTSWILLSFVFPEALDNLRQAAIEYMQAAGTPQEEYNRQMTLLDNTTPMSQAIPGGVGTFFTSVVAGAVIAIFKRRK